MILIDNHRQKRNFEGKEAWWAPLEEIEPSIKGLGYTDEEINIIVDIGHSRGIFTKSEPVGRVLLYCRPIDVEEMKADARAKLAILRAETAEFIKLPSIKSSFDFDAMENRVSKINDESNNR